MAKISRNAPCPCGSGKKYKRCCLANDEDARAAASPASSPPPREPPRWVLDDDDLDILSNRAVDLLQAGRLDDAEAVARDLLDRYPEVPDGLERLAAVTEARGNLAEAADLYSRAADLIKDDPNYESEPFYREEAERLRSLATSS